ncbi:Two-component response regulator ORR9 [Ananas comosus]|uniref:Two-component response regulator ORR9 n=1 Tax=Ananas comosus TaxID=4615 RepID=A0A199VCF1_ANACO|nr:Two-component response regulator ORR9 [Ananas comosus]
MPMPMPMPVMAFGNDWVPGSDKQNQKSGTKNTYLVVNLGKLLFLKKSWKLIERLLKTSSYQVTTVDSGTKALELLGLQDDQTNTLSYPTNQQESSSLKDIPVVIMSSENVPSRINRCLEEGADEFFLKPVQLSDMSRLKPHLLKRKSKDCNSSSANTCNESNNESSSSKRKQIDDYILPERTRPRLFFER